MVRETDLASGTFYNYFDDKEDAFRAVFDEWVEKARSEARAKRLQPGIDLERRIYDSYRAYFELVVADREMFEVLRRNADAIAMRGAEDLFAEAVRELAAGVNAVVAFVEYDRSPEGTYPVAIEQAYATSRWIVAQGARRGLDANRLAVAGDSVGGNMAAVLAILVGWIIADHRAQTRTLDDLEARGILRRSAGREA